jgi:dTDP-4-amino-4,6-dideoxygalactose transaminase
MGGTDVVGHTLLAYLGRSATFIYTTIRFQTGLQPVLLAERTHAGGIGTGVHYRGVHLHPYYRDRFAIDPMTLPAVTEISHRTLSLPFSPGLTEADQFRVTSALTVALGSDRRLKELARL